MSLKWAGYPYSIEKLRKLADSVVDDEGRSKGKEYIAQCLAEAWEEQQRLDKEIEELKEENKKITKLKNRAVKHIMKLNKEIKELKDETSEEEVDKLNCCCECNTKRECLSDTFVTIRKLDGTESVMCGMCSLNHFESKCS